MAMPDPGTQHAMSVEAMTTWMIMATALSAARRVRRVGVAMTRPMVSCSISPPKARAAEAIGHEDDREGHHDRVHLTGVPTGRGGHVGTTGDGQDGFGELRHHLADGVLEGHEHGAHRETHGARRRGPR